MRPISLVSLIAVLSLAGAASAQGNPAKASPAEAVTASRADQPITVAPTPQASDLDVQHVVSLLTGTFESVANGDQPALLVHGVPVTISGLDNAVLLEVDRLDSPADPFRIAVLHAYKRQGSLRLRVFDLAGNPGLKDTLVGIWSAPQAFPKLTLANLAPNVDMPLTADGDGFKGATTQPFPTMRDGAIEMTSAISISPTAFSIADAGFDADGKMVWGRAPANPIVFARHAHTISPATTLDGGLIIITLIPPKPGAPKLAENGELTAHYSGWLTDGTRFDSSRQPGRDPFKIRIPGPVIKGWNDGLKGIAQGERRRLIIPAALGYGDKGAGRGLIPANATLIFDVECLHIDNSQPPSPAPAPAPLGQPGGKPGQPAPEPGTSGAPIGKPSNNSQPEKPR